MESELDRRARTALKTDRAERLGFRILRSPPIKGGPMKGTVIEISDARACVSYGKDISELMWVPQKDLKVGDTVMLKLVKTNSGQWYTAIKD